ncbi:MAG TPA: hypothetical protein VNE82_19820 [Candidatus Binataceae bacterium]|nr:hypothetical protein [Candidatus Binataceae bacterium]
MLKRLAMLFSAAALAAAPIPAFAQHLAQAQGLAAQSYVSYLDVSLTAAGPAVQILAANPARVTAICQNTGPTNTARVGDAGVGASRGAVLYANGAGVTFDVTSAIYAYSAAGTTINCAEVVRQ